MSNTLLLDCVARADQARTMAALTAEGFTIREIPGQDVHDGPSFRDALARHVLGWPSAPKGWDECEEGLTNFLDELEAEPIAFFWTHADRMLDGRLLDLFTAVDILLIAARHQYTSGRPVVVRLVGEGPNFPLLNR